MGRSIVVEVRKALVAGVDALLNADPVFDGVSCTYYWQGNDDQRREQVFTANPSATHDPVSMKSGRTFRDERMEFDVLVKVAVPGEPPDVADERALDIGQLVEQWVADHASGQDLGIDGLNWIVMTRMTSANLVAPSSGSITEITYTVRYAARLT